MSGTLARARSLLVRSGAWLDPVGPHYALRVGPDRRARALLTLDEAAFRSLIDTPGLKARPGGGWCARPLARTAAAAAPASPGRVEGVRTVMAPDGTLTTLRANLGEGALAWLARRTDAEGRPWLSTAEVAAGERLRADAERAQSGPSLTMRWDALPRAGGGSALRAEPGDRALNAARRVAEALDACEPRARAFLDHICIRGSGLQAAEQDFGLRRREGKTLLKQGLRSLAAHYRIGV